MGGQAHACARDSESPTGDSMHMDGDKREQAERARVQCGHSIEQLQTTSPRGHSSSSCVHGHMQTVG